MFEKVAYRGWSNCLRLANDHVELIITTDVGPRILSYARKGGANVFKEYDDAMGVTSGEAWCMFGGHRLWHAPEDPARTYVPDFDPVDVEWSNGVLTLRPPEEKGTGIRKEIEVTLDPGSSNVRVVHRLFNHGVWEIELAAWSLSVMDQGARAIVPQEPRAEHPDALLPARPLVLWPYTDMSDARWTWGRRFVQLRQDAAAGGPQKVGLFSRLGWVACAVKGCLFLVKYPVAEGRKHADFGCNTELFTNADMLEVETLGPLVRIPTGGSTEHVEHWGLFEQEVGESEEAIADAVLPCLRQVRDV